MGKVQKKPKRLDPDEKRRREAYARNLFAQDPYLKIDTADKMCAKEFGEPLGRTKLSAIRTAYRLINGIEPPPSSRKKI